MQVEDLKYGEEINVLLENGVQLPSLYDITSKHAYRYVFLQRIQIIINLFISRNQDGLLLIQTKVVCPHRVMLYPALRTNIKL